MSAGAREAFDKPAGSRKYKARMSQQAARKKVQVHVMLLQVRAAEHTTE